MIPASLGEMLSIYTYIYIRCLCSYIFILFIYFSARYVWETLRLGNTKTRLGNTTCVQGKAAFIIKISLSLLQLLINMPLIFIFFSVYISSFGFP